MSAVIKVENVTKGYRLGQLDRRSFFSDWKKKLSGRETLEDDPNAFWALRGVTFDIQSGQVVGILGRNGAGKSTLLKILSMITAPTSGRVRMKGRVASLLEVGSGFHQEFTGRDNIFMNGAILGMTRREVAAKLDAIIAFSGVERFIDTPVKRYSSGMRVRLAFAVAAFLEPEILIMDEVLAVGDAAFQAKCLGKVGEVSRAGRTVLFVSHNAAAIEALCTRGIVLQQGSVVFDGTQMEALSHYSGQIEGKATCLRDRTDRHGTGEIRVHRVELRDSKGQVLNTTRAGQDVEVWLHYEGRPTHPAPNLCVRLHITTELGSPVFAQFNDLTNTRFETIPERGAFVCRLSRLPLAPALYRIEYEVRVGRREAGIFDGLINAAELHVEPGDFFGTGQLPAASYGAALVDAAWRMEANHS